MIMKFEESKEATEVALLRDAKKIPGTLSIKRYDELKKKVQEQAKELSKTNEQLHLEIARRKQLEGVLKESKDILKGVLLASPFPKFVINRNHDVIYWNRALEKLTDVKADKILGTKNHWKAFYDNERPCMADFIVDGRIEEIPNWYQRKNKRSKFVLKYQGKYKSKSLGDSCDAVDFFPIVGKKGTWLHFTAAAIRNTEGDIIGAVETINDINTQIRAQDEIRNSMEENEVVLREIHHMVKNNLRLLSSVLNFQSQNITDEKIRDIYTENQNRVKSVMLIHEKFYKSEDPEEIDFGNYIKSLILNLFNSYKIDKNRVKLDIDITDILLNLNTSIPLGLIINELVTNSIKHGLPVIRSQEPISGLFPDSDKIKSKIAVKIVKDDGYYVMTVYDNGVGFPEDLDFRNTKTLGMQLVISLTNKLKGTVTLERENGTLFYITFKKLNYRDEIDYF